MSDWYRLICPSSARWMSQSAIGRLRGSRQRYKARRTAEEMPRQIQFDIDKLEAVRGALNIAVREDRVRSLDRRPRGLTGAETGGASGKAGSTSVKISAKGRTNDRYCAQGRWRMESARRRRRASVWICHPRS